MLLPSEVEARATIPALRAIVAKKLVREHGMAQQKVASILGLTQSAISNYLRETRGKDLSIENSKEVQSITDEIVTLTIQEENPIYILSKFYDASNFIKERRLLCSVHQRLEPTLDIEQCHVCESKASSR